jgi:cytoplasmic iron level regulating protein YaaA (DUF328/UPF0246 family)
VLIILPPSETKRPPPDSGPSLDLDALSFPELNPRRRRVLAALIKTSRRPDAFERLQVRPTLVEQVLRNTVLHEVPTRPAAEVYAGPLYAGLDFAGLGAQARARADSAIVITSALWGLLRPSDRIPAYRLYICARLSGMDRLEPTWRPLIAGLLADEARRASFVLDLRSPAYQAMGRPPGFASRTVTIRVLPEAGARSIGDVVGKRIRGEIARFLLESRSTPGTPDQLASALNQRWSARLDPPDRPAYPWRLSVRQAD